MTEHKELLSKWLRVLFYTQAASMALTVVNAVSNLDSITAWILKAINLTVLWSLFQIKAVNPRYGKAALAKAVVLVCGFLTTPINSSALGLSSILLLVGATASWIAAYQEYHGHGELAAEQDQKLAEQWNSLFLKEILIGLGISVISTVGTTVLVTAGAVTGTITTVIIILSTICNLALEGLYLHYMKRTLTLFETET